MRDFALEVYFSKWEFKARYHMTASDAQSMQLNTLLDMASPGLREEFNTAHLGYTPTWGDDELRSLIASGYAGLQMEDILCFAGAEEGIYAAMRVLLEPTDHVLVVTPNYQAAETLPLDICRVDGVPLDPKDGWRLNLDRLRDSLKENTKLISINFPNNPTGSLMTRAEFQELIELCRERDIWLFSDEVYRGVERNPRECMPQAAELYEKGLSLNVLSKAYGLPGLRIGWIACRDSDALLRRERYKHYLSICNSVPSEILAKIALENRETILETNRNLIRSNLVHLDGFFGDHPELFRWTAPKGGCVGFPEYLGADGVEEFCRRLVEEQGVLLLPSSLYRSEIGKVPENHFRIGFGRHGTEDGRNEMRRFIRKNR